MYIFFLGQVGQWTEDPTLICRPYLTCHVCPGLEEAPSELCSGTVSFGPLLQHVPHDLAVQVPGDLWNKRNATPESLGGADPGVQIRVHVLLRNGCRGRRPHDVGPGQVIALTVGDADDADIGHPRTLTEDGFELGGGDLVAFIFE